MMLFTRAMNISTREDYMGSLKTSQLALFGYAELAEDNWEENISEFTFGRKLHWAVASATCVLQEGIQYTATIHGWSACCEPPPARRAGVGLNLHWRIMSQSGCSIDLFR
jgi:hypothetical protein